MAKKHSSLISAHSIKNRPRAGLLNVLFYTSLIATGLTSGIASAASDSANDPTKARWFQVELILFAHNNSQALDAEQWPEIIGIELPRENLLELHLPAAMDEDTVDDVSEVPATESLTLNAESESQSPTLAPSENTPTESGPIAFQILDESSWQLGKTAQRLKRSSRFEPLLHVAWQQPTYGLAQAKPILFYNGMADALPPLEPSEESSETTELGSEVVINDNTDAPLPEDREPVYASEADTLIGPNNPRLIGTVKLSVARYLHLAVDLLYRLPTTQQNAVPVSDFDLWYDRPYPTLYEPQGPAFRLEEWQAIRGFRMLESRRMRSKVLHYLDHPMFGMVVLITPVKLPVVEPAATDDAPITTRSE